MKRILALWLFSLLTLKCSAQSLPYKAVALGSWLLIEGWMTPHLFDGIINKDLLDGTKIHLKSTSLNRYLCAENGGGSALVANSISISDWETFRLWRINETTFNFRVSNKDFIGLSTFKEDTKLFAGVKTIVPGVNETFVIVRNKDNPLRVRILAGNGYFLQALSGDSVTADYEGSPDDWNDENPSVFDMSIVPRPDHLEGEYQLTNGYGPEKAAEVLRKHWNTYIVEEDFKYISENGLTAVRLPVGWWIMYGPNPPKPFVGGSLQILDNAFTWAEKYNIKVIVDLHAAPGSQNVNDHCGTRDGFQEWGAAYIPQTVAVVDFLAKRYANRLGLGGFALLNEPVAPLVLFEDLVNYYKQAYDAVRKYSSTAYVIMSNRLGLSEEENKELLPLTSSLPNSAIEVHYYNMFSDLFVNFTAQQHIDHIYNERAKSLQEITPPGNGPPLIFIGEWTAELPVLFEREVYLRFIAAQLEVYSKATFGWSFWAYKCVHEHWSLRWMIKHGYINFKNLTTKPELIGLDNKSTYSFK